MRRLTVTAIAAPFLPIIAHRDAVKRHHQMLGRARPRRAAKTVRQGFDIASSVRGELQDRVGHARVADERFDGTGGRPRSLREERNDTKLAGKCERLAKRRTSVAVHETHLAFELEFLSEPVTNPPGAGLEGRALIRPDRPILLGDTRGTRAQYPRENRPPQPPRIVDHHRVREELVEKSAHSLLSRRRRSTQIDEKNPIGAHSTYGFRKRPRKEWFEDRGAVRIEFPLLPLPRAPNARRRRRRSSVRNAPRAATPEAESSS